MKESEDDNFSQDNLKYYKERRKTLIDKILHVIHNNFKCENQLINLNF